MNWKRIVGWVTAIFLLLTVFGFVAGYIILRSKHFHRFVISKVAEKASQATGGRVTIENYQFSPSTLTATVYGIIVHGTEPADRAPLAAIDRLTIKLKILSVLHQKVDLDELVVERPVLHLLVNKNGQLNIPSPKAPADTSSQTDIFDLAVGHVGLNNGEIYYNDVKTPLQADLENLEADIRFSSLRKAYNGSLRYETGHLQYGNYQPLPHSLKAQFSVTPSEASLSSLELQAGHSTLSVRASLADYGNPRADGTYQLVIHPEDFAGMVQNFSVGGDVTLAGGIRYQNSDQPFLKRITLNGRVESPELLVVNDQGRVAVSSLRGEFELANGDLAVHPIVANVLDGRVLANVSMRHLDATPDARLKVHIQRISLQAAKRSLKSASVRSVPIDGILEGIAEAAWVGNVQNIRASSDLNLQGSIQGQTSSANVPLRVFIRADYDGRQQKITVRQTSINTPETLITADGQVSKQSNLALKVRTSNLEEISRIASSFQPAPAKPFHVSGAASVDGVVRGSMRDPVLDAQLGAQNLQVEGSSWRTLRTGLHASKSQLLLQNSSLVSARQGQITATAKIGLKNWSYTPSSAVSANASIRQMPIADLQQLARANYPVSGILTGDITLHGSQLSPVGNGTLQLTKAEAYNQPIQNLALKFQGTGDSIHTTLSLATPAGGANGDLTYAPKTRAYQLTFQAPRIVLQQLQAIQAKNLAVHGFLRATAHGSGTIDNPQLVASVEMPQVQVSQTALTGVKADLEVAHHLANLTIGSDIANASIRGQAKVNLSGDYYTEATIDSTRVALDPLLAVYVSNLPTGAAAEIELHASLKGPLKDKSRIEAHLQIPTLQARYRQLQIANAGPIRVDYANNLLTIQPSELKGTDTSLHVSGRVPIQSDRPMDLTAQGQLNLKLAKIFVPDVQSAGTLNLDLHGTGNFGKPGVKGQVRLQDVAFTPSDAPIGVEKLNGVLDIENGQVRISQLQGQSGGGQITGSGTINYEPQVVFNVGLGVKGVRLLYPTGVRSVFDGNLAITGNMEAAGVNGQVLIDSLSFTPDFDLASTAAQASTPSLPPANPTFADNVKLNVAVESSSDLSAASSTVSIEGAVNLRIIGTAANPVVVGRTDLTSGDVFFAGQRYQLDRGLINFTSPTRTEPYLNVLITTTIEQYNLNLTFVGPIEKLETKYTSDPPLPPVDIINLIARGKTTEESVPGNFSANQVLAQGLASQVSSRIGKFAGISSLTIDPLLGGNNQNPSARVAVQQRVTKNFIFTFSTDVTQPQSEIVQGEYQINKRWSVSATRDQYGGFAFDGRYHTSF